MARFFKKKDDKNVKKRGSGLFKLAYQCGVDVEDALRAGMVKADTRHPLETGAPEMARYLAQQAHPES